MGQTACEYNWHDTGKQVFYDNSTFETLMAMYPISFYDDFGGPDLVIPAMAGVQSGCKWAKKIVGAAPPTAAKSASVVNAHVLCSLTAAGQKQDAAINWDDQLSLTIAQGAIFETRLSLTTIPTLNGIASFGLWGAWKDAGSDYRVGFEVPAGGVCACECDDNATDTSATSGTTLVAGTYYVFRVDCTTQTDIKFFINGARVASGTTFNNAANTANSRCQPHLGLYKSAGAGLGVMSIDYVKVWMNRS